MKRLVSGQKGFVGRYARWLEQGARPVPPEQVADLLDEIRAGKEQAVLELCERFDGARFKRFSELRLDEDRLRQAARSLDSEKRQAIKEAIACVEDFHRQTLPTRWRGKNAHGATVGENFYPVQRVGLYIPGGQVPLVSTVIMTAVPARIAGCPEIVVCTPPRPDGSVDESLLAALWLVGVREVYTLGGVQAIGAMALGLKSLPRVDLVAGPGSGWVMEAKRQLYGEVGIDLLPGPSEVMVAADETASPAYAAAELLAQAEHGTGKERVLLAGLSKKFLDAVEAEAGKQVASLKHAKAIRAVLKKSLALELRDYDELVWACNQAAPEHLQLMVASKLEEKLASKITTAGAILLGHTTPTVLGDFTAGPSHTLPTGGTGRFSSGLQVTDFMRRSSIVRYRGRRQLAAAAPVVRAFSAMEDLDAHGQSLELRLEES